MTGIPEKDTWLTRTPAYKVLGFGENRIDFALKLKNLLENNETRFRRLMGICERLEFVEQILHTSRIAVSGEGKHKAEYQLDRLITYLTTTCIDVATGEGFQTYKSWLRRAYKSNSLNPDIWNLAMQQLSSARSDEIPKLFIDWSTRIYEDDYQHNQSIRKAFKEFIQNLDGWAKDWLFNEYIIQIVDSCEVSQEPIWANLSAVQKSERIAYYLYDLRNKYTHSVDSFEPMNSKQRSFGKFDGPRKEYLSTIFQQSSGPSRKVLLRSGLFESDIIRFLISIWLRKNWLAISDDEPAIQKYWSHITYRRLGFNFLAELDENERLIKSWCSYPLSPLFDELSFDIFQLQTLYYLYAEKFIAKHRETSQIGISICNEDTYLALIKDINSKIADYNSRHAKLTSNARVSEVKDLFAELINLRETHSLYRYINDLKRDLFRSLDKSYHQETL